jgi:hypothetical protein
MMLLETFLGLRKKNYGGATLPPAPSEAARIPEASAS